VGRLSAGGAIDAGVESRSSSSAAYWCLNLEIRPVEYLKSHVTPENLCIVSKRLIMDATNRIEARS